MATQRIKFEDMWLDIVFHCEKYAVGEDCEYELVIDSVSVIDSVINIQDLISEEKNEEIYKTLTEYLEEVKAGI